MNSFLKSTHRVFVDLSQILNHGLSNYIFSLVAVRGEWRITAADMGRQRAVGVAEGGGAAVGVVEEAAVDEAVVVTEGGDEVVVAAAAATRGARRRRR